jgi:hypothetical protein
VREIVYLDQRARLGAVGELRLQQRFRLLHPRRAAAALRGAGRRPGKIRIFPDLISGHLLGPR